MTKPGPEKRTTVEEVLQYMKDHDRTGWSAPDLADHFGVSRPTIKDRLDTLVERGDVATVKVGQATAYLAKDPFGEDSEQQPEREQEIWESIQQAFNNRFVGTERVWPTDNFAHGDVEEGDEIQLRIEGNLSGWDETAFYFGEDRREELKFEEKSPGLIQALITASLIAKPTTPIEHFSYGRNTDLEQWADAKPELFEPSNSAYFLMNVRIVDLSMEDEGEDIMREAATTDVSKDPEITPEDFEETDG